jgi:hypothetical protein
MTRSREKKLEEVRGKQSRSVMIKKASATTAKSQMT